MQNNKHLSIREQFYLRMANKLLRNPDTSYTFMKVVCETISIADLPTIEAIFSNRAEQKLTNKNWEKNKIKTKM